MGGPAIPKPRKRNSKRLRPRTRLGLTTPGWLFLGMAVLVGAAATRGQGPLAFVLFGGMMAALHVSAVVAWGSLRAVNVERDLAQRLWQHRTVHLGYHLRNSHKRRSCLGLEVSEIEPQGIESAKGYCVNLPARGVFRSGGRFVAHNRGRVLLRGIGLSTVFPFGLVRASRIIKAPAEMVVWPAKGKLLRQMLKRGAVETSGAAPSPATSGQDEFFGLREYRPDDNPRWIAWKRSANKPMPVVREMSRPLPEMLYLIVDVGWAGEADAAQGGERTLRLAATLADYAFRSGYKVGLALNGHDEPTTMPPAEGSAHRTRLLDALALASFGQRDLTSLVEAIPPRHLARTQVILLTGDQRRLEFSAQARLQQTGRHLTVIDQRNMDAVFSDATDSEEADDAA